MGHASAPARPVTEREYTESGRAFRMAYLLILHGPMTIRQLAASLECTERNVYYLRDSVSNAAPLRECDDGRLALPMDMADWY